MKKRLLPVYIFVTKFLFSSFCLADVVMTDREGKTLARHGGPGIGQESKEYILYGVLGFFLIIVVIEVCLFLSGRNKKK
jgi:hypothetical protein